MLEHIVERDCMITAPKISSHRSKSALEGRERSAEWVLFQLQMPGRELRPAGVLLLDKHTDQLHVSLRDLIGDEVDEDLLEIWNDVAEDLRAKVDETGGSQVLEWLEADASHIFQISARRQIVGRSADPSTMVEELFHRYVLGDRQFSAKRLFFLDRTFSSDQIEKARAHVGPLPSATIQILTLLEDPNLHFRQAEQVIGRDPVLAAHLLRAANVAAFQDPARTLFSALQRLGLEAVKFQVLALTVRKVFSSPAVRKVWDHSIATAQLARKVAQSSSIPPGEAGLLGLVHDIGQVVLFGLGELYPVRVGELRAQGLTTVQAERALCGTSHAEIGANLLSSWSFPADMVEAVAAHHQPARSDTPLTALLYLAEAYGENDEDIYDVEQHALAAHKLLLPSAALGTNTGIDSDLAVLRFAA